MDDNATRWLNRAPLPHWIEFTWATPVRLGAARIISGYCTDGTVQAPIQAFRFQWYDGNAPGKTFPVPRSKTTACPPGPALFDAVDTARLRLGITATQDNISRIWEVELYAPPIQGQP